jgi:hypothetical protein
MATEKINLKDLERIIIAEAEKMMNLGDPIDANMNKMDSKLGNSKGDSLVMSKEKGGFEKKSSAPKAAKNIEDTEEPLDVDMNELDGDQGHDEKIAAAVKVDATGSKKNGPSTAGQANAKFDSKKGNPTVGSSEPFEDRKAKVDMNAEDKEGTDGAKTYVEPGSEMSKGMSTGQHKANFSEKAKNEKEKAEVIAKGIQLPESFKNKKELMDFINEEAKKLSKLI